MTGEELRAAGRPRPKDAEIFALTALITLAAEESRKENPENGPQ
jgi:hypothetical protein